MKISKKTQRYIEIAKKTALNNQSKFRHGAVLVKGGSVINTAVNKKKYNSFGNRFRNIYTCGHATHHAELSCILGIDKNKTQGATIYVARVNNQGEPRNSRPCPMCQEVLKFVGVKKVIFTKNDGQVGLYKL